MLSTNIRSCILAFRKTYRHQHQQLSFQHGLQVSLSPLLLLTISNVTIGISTYLYPIWLTSPDSSTAQPSAFGRSAFSFGGNTITADVSETLNTTISTILARNPNVTIRDYRDMTALHYAVAINVGRWSTYNGANARNLQEDVPVALGFVKKILKLGADVNAVDITGDTVCKGVWICF